MTGACLHINWLSLVLVFLNLNRDIAKIKLISFRDGRSFAWGYSPQMWVWVWVCVCGVWEGELAQRISEFVLFIEASCHILRDEWTCINLLGEGWGGGWWMGCGCVCVSHFQCIYHMVFKVTLVYYVIVPIKTVTESCNIDLKFSMWTLSLPVKKSLKWVGS